MNRIYLIFIFLLTISVTQAQTINPYVDSLKKVHTRKAGYRSTKAPTIKFDTNFESGSLGRAECLYVDRSKKERNSVFLIESRSDPRNPFDSTYITSGRWFFFRMVGVKNHTIHMLFENTDPTQPVYSYDGEHFERFTQSESQKGRTHKTFERDTVYVAYCQPYTHGRLMRKTAQWIKDSSLNIKVIGFSTEHRPIYLYTFCDPSVDESQKRQIYAHSRIHTSETPASFVLEGFIDQLMERKELLRSVTFHIVPFANPDGVVGGYSRSNVIGVDLERNFVNSTSPIQPETEVLLRAVERLYDKQPLDVMLNIHAQIFPKLMLWMHTAATSSKDYYDKEVAFFDAVVKHNELFCSADSAFARMPESAIERWAWERGRGRTLAQTFEATYEQLNTTPPTLVTEENMLLTGRRLLNALEEFLEQPEGARRLMKAYPQTLVHYFWGAFTTINRELVAYNDTIFSVPYPKGALLATPTTDPGRIRDEMLLKAMYGSTEQETKSHLVSITWCPKLIGQKAYITSRNNVHLALQKVSDELDQHPEWKKYLRSSGTYTWRPIAGTDRLSARSFGIAIDIGLKHSYYWRWDYPKADESTTAIDYRNKIPQGIVDIFEKHGFIWGGKWFHYDTMHFEYRPELL